MVRVLTTTALLQISTPLIKNVLLLDSEGKRVAVKYYSDDWPTLSAKLAFEKSVFSKTQRTSARSEGISLIFPFYSGFVAVWRNERRRNLRLVDSVECLL